MEKTDCFAYRTTLSECAVLTDKICTRKECPFYKTKEKFQDDMNKYDRTVKDMIDQLNKRKKVGYG